MAETRIDALIAAQVRTLRIIVFAMVMGPSIFLAVVLAMGPLEGQPPADALAAPVAEGAAASDHKAAPAANPFPLLSYMSLAMAVAVIAARLILPASMLSAARRKIVDGTWQPLGGAMPQVTELVQQTGDAGPLLMLMQTRTIVSVALLEGGAFFATVAYMLERNAIALAVAAALIIGVALHFPSVGGATAWIEGQLRRIDEERALRR